MIETAAGLYVASKLLPILVIGGLFAAAGACYLAVFILERFSK